MESHIEVHAGEETPKFYAMEADQLTVGRSPTAGIPLVNAHELLPEHFLLAPRKDGCWVSVAQDNPVPVYLEGRPVTGELVPWDSELTVASLRVVVRRGPPPTPGLFSQDKGPVSKRERFTKAAVRGLAGLVLVMVAVVVFFGSNNNVEPPNQDPPDLFPNLALACPEGDPGVLAKNFSYEALARMDRYPFDSQEGILAVQAHSRAIACFRRIGDQENAREEHQRRAILVQKLNEDYRARRLHLERALERSEDVRALQLTQELLPMIMHRKDSRYTQWLAVTERHLVKRVNALLEDD